MKFKVDTTKKISVLKEEFNALFPFLKIEIFNKPHKVGEGTHKKMITPDYKTLKDCGALNNGIGIDIHPTMTVAELEQGFLEHYGLGLQVFRRSGKLWLETSLTDAWTLEQQNKHGEALSS